MIKNIKILKILTVINPIIVILSIYIVDFNDYFVKPLLAFAVMILCIIEYSLLDKLHKNTKSEWIKSVAHS